MENILVLCVLFTLFSITIFIGDKVGIGPFKFIKRNKIIKHPGNNEKYHIKNIKSFQESPLKDKKLLFLGSSVTYGASSLGISMADYIQVMDKCEVIKESVNGTTLVNQGKLSYISRLKKINPNLKFDIVVCQLSTNDATLKKEIGKINSVNDDKTVIGAIEEIIQYCYKTWKCPIVFYTNPKYGSKRYEEMVNALIELKQKYKFTIVDFWNDSRNIDNLSLYMYDDIHPTQAGYLEWWTPVFQKHLYLIIKKY